jgi:hypothetical protein
VEARNPFRFGSRTAAPRTGEDEGPEGPDDGSVAPSLPATQAGPVGPAPPPPIPLRFIGIVELREQHRTLAVLSDGRGTPFYGKEGDIIEGRYRIVRIGLESIELAYVDGRGQQTIRLSGS